jgi:hypothetical protein
MLKKDQHCNQGTGQHVEKIVWLKAIKIYLSAAIELNKTRGRGIKGPLLHAT